MVWFNADHDIRRCVSNNLGSSWGSIQTVANANGDTRLDPFGACNIFDGNSPPHMAIGWYFDLDPVHNQDGAWFDRTRSESDGLETPQLAQVQDTVNTDRPWLVWNTASLYLAFSDTHSATNPLPTVKRAATPSGSNAVDWSATPVKVDDPRTSAFFIGNFPIAAHTDGGGSEVAYVAARQAYNGAPPDFFFNMMRIYRSTDLGISWSMVLNESIQGIDGYIADRDKKMLSYHVSCDPAANSHYVYVFYVRNEPPPLPFGPDRRNILYCKYSTHDGDSGTWSGERFVYSLPQSENPSEFANVNDGNPGFYRIGRVWSCVDPSGNVYVCWMDNRYGKYSGDGVGNRDYWHVYYSKSTDHGEHWSAPVRVSAPSYTSDSDIKSHASIGGALPAGVNWVPPGDFLTCDCDGTYLYVAWPDSREDQGSTTVHTASIYVNPILL